MQTSVLGTIEVPFSPLPPQYRGVSRRQKPSEALIDSSYSSGNTDAVLQAVFSHVERLYRSAPYLERGQINSHLASIVSLEVLRKLPWEPCDLTPVSGQNLLSHVVNRLAKCRHLDEIRKHSTRRQHEVLSRDIAHRYPDVEGDLITHISDVHQGKEYHVNEQERKATVAEFLTTLTDERDILRKAERWGTRRRPTVPRPRKQCVCWNCNRPPLCSMNWAHIPK
jgi:hypothetical protein